jgi:hypothetical protein
LVQLRQSARAWLAGAPPPRFRVEDGMSTSKHEKVKGEGPFKSDLERNPGIGQSKGSFATGEDPETLEGLNTVEGDVENAATPSGAADVGHEGRTNR